MFIKSVIKKVLVTLLTVSSILGWGGGGQKVEICAAKELCLFCRSRKTYLVPKTNKLHTQRCLFGHLYFSMWMVFSATLANSIICQFSEIEMIVLTFKFKMKSYGVTSEMKHSLQLCHLVLIFGH